MRVVFAVLCVAVAAQAASLYQDEWQAFKTKHGKVYSAEEDSFRFKVFVENSKLVEEHNRLFEQGQTTFTMAMNKFGDMLSHEFASVMNGYKSEMKKPSSKVFDVTGAALPDTVDWRPKGAVTPVKDQGQCGSCWSFSSTGALEGQHFLKTGDLVSLSEQNLVDCTGGKYGNQGCNGGWMDASFTYISDNDGIDTESSYPYHARDGTCSFDPANVGATDTGFTDITKFSESALQEASANVGPIAVAIDASHASFQLYSGGVYNEAQCSKMLLDHAVLVVGYGTEMGKDYWLVKNSWGTSWGEEGYIKMSRNDDNQCGIATQASYPTV